MVDHRANGFEQPITVKEGDMSMNPSPDSYITGNYGENQFDGLDADVERLVDKIELDDLDPELVEGLIEACVTSLEERDAIASDKASQIRVTLGYTS